MRFLQQSGTVCVSALCLVYFCQLARAHVRRCGDVEIDEQAGVRLGVSPVLSVNRAIRELLGDAHVQFESRETVDLLAAIFVVPQTRLSQPVLL